MEKEKLIIFLVDRYASQRLITISISKKKDSVAPFLADRGFQNAWGNAWHRNRVAHPKYLLVMIYCVCVSVTTQDFSVKCVSLAAQLAVPYWGNMR